MIFEKPVVIPFFNEDDFYGSHSHYPSLLSPSKNFFGNKKSENTHLNPESNDHYFIKTNFYEQFKEKCEEPQYISNDFIPRIITPVPDFAEVLRS